MSDINTVVADLSRALPMPYRSLRADARSYSFLFQTKKPFFPFSSMTNIWVGYSQAKEPSYTSQTPA